MYPFEKSIGEISTAYPELVEFICDLFLNGIIISRTLLKRQSS